MNKDYTTTPGPNFSLANIEKAVKSANRTQAQNNSLWLYFTHVADELNAAGYDIRKTVKVMQGNLEIPWSKQSVHDILWVTIQKTLYGKESTRELSKKGEIDEVHDVLNRFLGERLGIEYIPFPSIEEVEKTL